MAKVEKIIKRDGRILDFDEEKIISAIFKAARAVGGQNYELAKKLAHEVVIKLEEGLDKGLFKEEYPSVEEIQDIVEKVLIDNGHSKTAKAYILYRKQREQTRNIDSIFKMEIIDKYLKKSDWRVKENANMTYSLQGLNNHISSVLVSKYWVERIYDERMKKAHEDGDFHIHDLGTLGAYCVGWDLKDLLMVGFTGVHGKIESKPAKHLRTILGQIVNFFYTLQGEAAGAQAFSNFDTLLAPFIRYDGLTKKEVKQALQEFLFNVNVPTRVGFQTPFTNITIDLTVPNYMKDEPVIIGGEFKEETYGDFQEEMDLFNECYAEVMLEGDAHGRVFTFPIPTYNITKDFDWENPKYNKLWEMTAKYGIPYFSNFVNSDMSPEDARSMCCRLRLDNRELRKRGGGLFGANPLTGSVGVVTLNMPRLAYLSKDYDELIMRLDKLMDLARESLEIKRKVIEHFTENGLYPYSKYYLRTTKQAFGRYWKNHFSTIGVVGMNECCLNLIGKSIGTKEGKELAEKILSHIRERIGNYQEETNNLYNLEATPAEGTSYRLARLDKQKYPDIIVANERAYRERGAAPYYTNSSLLPVNYTDDIFEALDNQDDLQTKYTGGTVLHIFVGDKISSPNVVKNLVRKITNTYRLPYISITPTFSICPKHGYIPGEHKYCPICDEELEIKKEHEKLEKEIDAIEKQE